MKSPSAPAPVDTAGAAVASANSNLNMANLATMANRVNTENQNGRVQYTYEDKFNAAAYNRAMDDWRKAGSNKSTMPQQNEYTERIWTQNEYVNPDLAATNRNNQRADKALSEGAQTLATKAKTSLTSNFNAPQLANYLKNAPALDQSKIAQVKAYDSNVKLNEDLANGLDRINVDNNTKNSKFTSTGTNLDTNVNDNLAKTGTIKDFAQQAAKFGSSAKMDTNIADNLKNVGNVDTYNGMNNAFKSTAKVDTNVNDNLKNVQALNQTGAKQMSDFKFNGPQVQNQINSNAKLDTNVNDNLARAGVDMTQQQFTDDGSRVKTNAPKFDERTADKYARAAYESQMAFQRGDFERDVQRASNKLALQGLGVDSAASRDAMGTIYDSQAKARNQLSNQSVLTGASVANQNYSSQLAGFQAGNSAEAQRFGQNQAAFQNNLAANAQAFNQNSASFDRNNAANQQQFQNDATRAQFANSAQNQAFSQAQAGYQNTLAGRQLNQQIINSANDARSATFQQEMAKFNANNAAAGQQFSQDNSAYQNQLAMNQQNSALTAARNAAQAQRYDQATNSYQLQNAANQAQFGMDSSAYQNNLSGLNQNLAINNANNANQQSRFNQALSAFNAGNDAKNAQFAQNQSAYNTNMAANMANANLKAMDNQNAMTQQTWRENNLAFTNQARLQANALSQQDYQNQLQAQAANMNLRNANNDIRSQFLNEQYQRYGADYSAAEEARYRSLNDYVALTNQTAVNTSNQYQPYAQQQQTGGVDYLSAANAQQQQQMAQYNSGVASANSTNSAIGQAATMAAMMFYMSDERLKKNIEKIGETDSGRDLYQWDWNKQAEKLGMTGSSQGVLAQENRDISKKMPNGFLAVDYSKINTRKKV